MATSFSPTQLVSVNGISLDVLTYKDKPVVTFEMIARVHEISVENVHKSFQRNKQRFVEGKHYFRVDFVEASQLGPSVQANPNGLTLFTEKGYLLLVKPLRDEKSWEVQERMVDEYFALREQAHPRVLTTSEMFLAQAQINVEHERKLALLSEQVASQDERLGAIEMAYTPPVGKVWPQDWMASSRKERLDSTLWKTFLEHARRLEKAEPFTPPGGAFPRWYYTPLTLEKAYGLATRQMLLLHRADRGA